MVKKKKKVAKKDKLQRPLVIFSDMDGCISPKQKIWYVNSETTVYNKQTAYGGGVGTHTDKFLDVMKPICDHDSGAISLIRQLKQVDLVFISGDERINRAYAERQSIPFIFTGKVKHSDKWEYLKAYWKERYGGKPNGKYIYIGDSIPDYHCLMNSGLGFVPADGSKLLGEALDPLPGHVRYLYNKGGEGVLEETLVELIRMGKLQRHSILKKLGVK